MVAKSQLIGGKHPTIHKGFQHVSTIQGGAGFLPSTVSLFISHSTAAVMFPWLLGDVAMAPWATNGLPRLVKSLVVWRIETMAPCSTNNLQNGSSQKIYLQIWSYKSWPIRISPSSPQNHRKLHTPPRWPVVSNHIERKALESAHTSCHDSPQKVDLKPSGSGTTIETQGLNGTSDEGFHVNVQDGAPVR